MRKLRLLVLFGVTLLTLAGMALADLTGVIATPNPVVIGNFVSAKATDDGNPPIGGATMTWTYNGTACPAPLNNWVNGACVSWCDDFQINATAQWNIPAMPTPISRTSGPISTTVKVIGPDKCTGSFPNGQNANFNGAIMLNSLLIQWRITARGSPLGFCAAPYIEERIWRDGWKWGMSQQGWNPWTGAVQGVFEWDVQTSSIKDYKRRPAALAMNPNGTWKPAGTPIDQFLQVIRVSFPDTCGNYWLYTSTAFQITVYSNGNGTYSMWFNSAPNPAPPFPTGT